MEPAKPPDDPELKNIIDKLANFVARNGPEFENMTKQKQRNNPKFAFLFGGEYYNYYTYRVITEQAIYKKFLSQQSQAAGGGGAAAPWPTNVPPPNIRTPGPGGPGGPGNVPVGLPPAGAPPVPGAAPPSGPHVILQLQQQLTALQDQIAQSEKNLAAQHQVINQTQEAKIDDAIKKAKVDRLHHMANECRMHFGEFEPVLEQIAATCTKEAIANGKGYYLKHSTNEREEEAFIRFLEDKIVQNETTFEARLHMIYLVNDILHHCARRGSGKFLEILRRFVLPMIAVTITCAEEDKKPKLNKLIDLWEKNNYFDEAFLKQLKNPDLVMQDYKNALRQEYHPIVEHIRTADNTRYLQLQNQHADFVDHAKSQIQQLQQQLQQISSINPPPGTPPITAPGGRSPMPLMSLSFHGGQQPPPQPAGTFPPGQQPTSPQPLQQPAPFQPGIPPPQHPQQPPGAFPPGIPPQQPQQPPPGMFSPQQQPQHPQHPPHPPHLAHPPHPQHAQHPQHQHPPHPAHPQHGPPHPQHPPQHLPQHPPQHPPQHLPQHPPQHPLQHLPQHPQHPSQHPSHPQHVPQHVPQHLPQHPPPHPPHPHHPSQHPPHPQHVPQHPPHPQHAQHPPHSQHPMGPFPPQGLHHAPQQPPGMFPQGMPHQQPPSQFPPDLAFGGPGQPGPQQHPLLPMPPARAPWQASPSLLGPGPRFVPGQPPSMEPPIRQPFNGPPLQSHFNQGPAMGLPDISKPPPGFGMEVMPSKPQADPPQPPYYDLPAGLMVPMVKPGDHEYKALDSREVKLPPPLHPTDRLLAAIEAFYGRPTHEKPRNADGWEQLGLYEFYRVKNKHKLKKERDSRSRSSSQSRSGSASRSHSRSKSRSRSRSRGSSRSRSRSPSRSPSPHSARRRSRSHSPSPSPRPTRYQQRRKSRSPSASPPRFGVAPLVNYDTKLDGRNKGHQLLQKMGWSGTGLGKEEQGIVEPIPGGEIRESTDHKGVGAGADPFEQFRKNRSASYIQRLKARDDVR